MHANGAAQTELAKKYCLVVVGGGPAGVAGALKGAYMGKRVLLIDKPKAAPAGGGLDFFFGGPTGLFSKALRDSAKVLDVASLSTMGLDRDVIFKQLQNSCLRLARNNAQTTVEVLSKFKVDYLQGEATLDLDLFNGRPQGADNIKLSVRPTSDTSTTVDVAASKVLLCTGSYASQPPSIPFDGKRVVDSDSVNGLDFLPKSVVVAGSGIIAIEMANIFRKLGAEVTMVVRSTAMSALERIGLDDTIAERLLKGLRDQGVTVLEKTEISEFDVCEVSDEDGGAIGGEDCDEVKMTLVSKGADGEPVPAGELTADLYIGCIGRRPRARGTSLALEANGITLDERSGHILVGDNFETSQPNIYAAGDCVKGPALASTGVDQAQKAVMGMYDCFGPDCKVPGQTPFPIGVWTIPEVGYYGLTLEAAKKAGYDAEVGIATYDACLRGRVFAPDGMLKLVFDRESTKILGVHIIGTDACELVHYGMDLVAKEATLFDVIGTVRWDASRTQRRLTRAAPQLTTPLLPLQLFTAVTFHELFKEAALNGNEKLEFGIQWQEVLSELQASMTAVDDCSSYDEAVLRARFDEIDSSGDGSLDEDELLQVFEALGSPVTPNLIANLIRLADDDGAFLLNCSTGPAGLVRHSKRNAFVLTPSAPPQATARSSGPSSSRSSRCSSGWRRRRSRSASPAASTTPPAPSNRRVRA